MSEINLVSPPEAHYTVYKLTSPENKVYIGCTGQKVERRWRAGKRYWSHIPIGKAIGEFGWENFNKEILCEKLTKDGAEKQEAWFVDYYDSMNPEKGYNCFSGGSRNHAHLSEVSRKRNSESQLAFFDGNTEFCLAKQQKSREYYSRHPEARAAISKQMSEYMKTPEGIAFIFCDRSPKPVRCVETGKTFRSASSAERETGFCSIHKVCRGKQKTSGGYHWEYI